MVYCERVYTGIQMSIFFDVFAQDAIETKSDVVTQFFNDNDSSNVWGSFTSVLWMDPSIVSNFYFSGKSFSSKSIKKFIYDDNNTNKDVVKENIYKTKEITLAHIKHWKVLPAFPKPESVYMYWKRIPAGGIGNGIYYLEYNPIDETIQGTFVHNNETTPLVSTMFLRRKLQKKSKSLLDFR